MATDRSTPQNVTMPALFSGGRDPFEPVGAAGTAGEEDDKIPTAAPAGVSSDQRRLRNGGIVEGLTPAISGYLTKRGKVNSRSWKTRWFEAFPGDDGVIVYYKNDKKTKQLGRIYLQNAEVQESHIAHQKAIYGFNIITKKRLWQIVTKDKEAASHWMEILSRECTSAANAKIIEAESLMSPMGAAMKFEAWGYEGTDLASDFAKLGDATSREPHVSPGTDANVDVAPFSMAFEADDGDSSTDDDDYSDEEESLSF